MVKTVEELTKNINKDQVKIIKNLENEIDSFLDENFDPYNKGEMYFGNVPNGYLGRVKNEIKKMYGLAGWKISYQSDQRDGDYIVIKPIKGKTE